MNADTLFQAFKDATSYHGREDLWPLYESGKVRLDVDASGENAIVVIPAELDAEPDRILHIEKHGKRKFSAKWEDKSAERFHYTLASVFSKELCR